MAETEETAEEEGAERAEGSPEKEATAGAGGGGAPACAAPECLAEPDGTAGDFLLQAAAQEGGVGTDGAAAAAPAAHEDEAEEAAASGASRLKSILEALIFCSETALSFDRLAALVDGCQRKELKAALDGLVQDYRQREGAFEIVEVAHGYQVRTRPELAKWVARLRQQRPARLSRAALEVAAIVAYRQPATRAEIESIRGVDCAAPIGSLLEKRLIRMVGRKEVPGRPILYGTTPEFLELFGLKDLKSLPTLKEIEGMFQKAEAEAGDGAGDGAEARAGTGPQEGAAAAGEAGVPGTPDGQGAGTGGIAGSLEAPAAAAGRPAASFSRESEREPREAAGAQAGAALSSREISGSDTPGTFGSEDGEEGEEGEGEEFDAGLGEGESLDDIALRDAMDEVLRRTKTRIVRYEDVMLEAQQGEAGPEGEDRGNAEKEAEDKKPGEGSNEP
ncbi:MAG: SMC-Scp complex subunit ScpB [bacterium]